MTALNLGPGGWPGEYAVYVCEGCGAQLHWYGTTPPGPCTWALGDRLPCGGAHRLVLPAVSS